MPITKLQEKMIELIAAGTPLVLVRTDEPEDVEHDLSTLCTGGDVDWDVNVWDCDDGLVTKDSAHQAGKAAANTDPVAAMLGGNKGKQSLAAAVKLLGKPRDADDEGDKDPVILIARNAHMFWRDGAGERSLLIQALANFYRVGKSEHVHVVMVGPPSATVPDEIKPLVTVVAHDLPSKEDFAAVIDDIDLGDKKAPVDDLEAVCLASCGLTRGQAEAAYAISLGRLSKIDPRVVEEYKAEVLNADGMLTQYKGAETFDDIGGNDALKEFLVKAMDPETRKRAKKPIRAVALVGPPGTGKTLAAKALGNHARLKTYAVDVGKTKSKWVGESEAGVRGMYAKLDAMAPIVAYYDEVNEQLGAGGGDDHSVDRHIVQATLVWLNDHTSDVFVVMTANNIADMHMALLRAGRVNAVFYVGLPGKKQKQAIWNLAIERYGLDVPDGAKLPDDTGWAGAEITECCAMADALACPLLEAARYIIPSSTRNAEKINSLKEWADGRVIDAETGLVYSKNKEEALAATGELIPLGQRRKRKVRAVK